MCSLITLWFRSTNTVLPRLLRAFSGGAITALALVHIVPEVGQTCCRASMLLYAAALVSSSALGSF